MLPVELLDNGGGFLEVINANPSEKHVGHVTTPVQCLSATRVLHSRQK